MRVDFSSETKKVRRKWHSIFQVIKRTINPKFYMQWKYPSGIKFVVIRPTLLKMAKVSSPNRKESMIKGILEHQERRTNTVNKNMGKHHRLSFSLEFSFLNYVWWLNPKL